MSIVIAKTTRYIYGYKENSIVITDSESAIVGLIIFILTGGTLLKALQVFLVFFVVALVSKAMFKLTNKK